MLLEEESGEIATDKLLIEGDLSGFLKALSLRQAELSGLPCHELLDLQMSCLECIELLNVNLIEKG